MRKILAILFFCTTIIFPAHAQNTSRLLRMDIRNDHFFFELEGHNIITRFCVDYSDVVGVQLGLLMFDLTDLTLKIRKVFLKHGVVQRYYLEGTQTASADIWIHVADPHNNFAGLSIDFQGDQREDVAMVLKSARSLVACGRKQDM